MPQITTDYGGFKMVVDKIMKMKKNFQYNKNK